jgi:hypothetical protein
MRAFNGVLLFGYCREIDALVSSFILILILSSAYILDSVSSLETVKNYMNTKPTFVGFDLGYGLELLYFILVCKRV